MGEAKVVLTPTQKIQIEGVVGHDLDAVKEDLGSVGNIKLTLTGEQSKLIKDKTGKDLSVLDLKEADLKKYSSIACYERGGIVVTS